MTRPALRAIGLTGITAVRAAAAHPRPGSDPLVSWFAGVRTPHRPFRRKFTGSAAAASPATRRGTRPAGLLRVRCWPGIAALRIGQRLVPAIPGRRLVAGRRPVTRTSRAAPGGRVAAGLPGRIRAAPTALIRPGVSGRAPATRGRRRGSHRVRRGLRAATRRAGRVAGIRLYVGTRAPQWLRIWRASVAHVSPHRGRNRSCRTGKSPHHGASLRRSPPSRPCSSPCHPAPSRG